MSGNDSGTGDSTNGASSDVVNATAPERRSGLASPTATAPLVRRTPMHPRPWVGPVNAVRNALTGQAGAANEQDRPLAEESRSWTAAASRRRLALSLAVFGSAALAVAVLAQTQPDDGTAMLGTLHLVLFGLLFAWVSAGFYTALMGYLSLLRGDPHALSLRGLPDMPIEADARTAIVMPICNEDIATVFGGLKATCESLASTGRQGTFDLFVLSDTSKPELRAAEMRAWRELRESMADSGIEVYYRWRRRRVARKSGNVADFCRRWGSSYRYMVVLDADSVMSGDCLVSMVRLMEVNPKVGIIQTQPSACGHDTLHARAQQFLGRVAGRLFSAGLQYWQLGESHYWGHNAILRIEPFMKHCALAKLPGKGGLSGDIMSHDFVEAALMRRAGYEVWLVDLGGSFEQPPPHLIDELQRDRRWCQGNLQNSRLIAEPGLRPVHRAMFITGAMSYVASPLWLGFAVLGLAQWFLMKDSATLPAAAPVLWMVTLAMLLLPRVLGVAWVLQKREQASFGGTPRLMAGAALEAGLAALQAPIRMVAHSTYVFSALTGLKLDWKSPSRDASKVSWRDAASRFGGIGMLVAAVLALLAHADPEPVMRTMPLWLPLLLAVPLAVLTSRVDLGSALRRRRLFLTPEEANSPALLQRNWAMAEVLDEVPAVPAPATAPIRVANPARGRRTLGLGRGLNQPAWMVPGQATRLFGRAMVTMAIAAVPVAGIMAPDQPLGVSNAYLHAAPAPYETGTSVFTLNRTSSSFSSTSSRTGSVNQPGSAKRLSPGSPLRLPTPSQIPMPMSIVPGTGPA
jgi:membrane glycosyltransferase